MIVRVIASKPDATKGIEQDHIFSLIGNEYNVISRDKEDESVNVYDLLYKSQITLNKGEYIVLEG